MSQAAFSLRDAEIILGRNGLKAVRIDLASDTCEMFPAGSEAAGETSDTTFSGWVRQLAASEDVYEKDAEEVLALTDVEALRERFAEDSEPVRVTYRRVAGSVFRWVEMVLVRTADYSETNETILLILQDIHTFYEEERQNREEADETLRADAARKVESTPAPRKENKWVDAAFFDLEAEIERQGKAIRAMQKQCQGKEYLSAAEVTENLARMKKGNSAMRDIITNVHNIHGDEERAAVLSEKPHNLRTFLEHFNDIALERTKAVNIGFRAQFSDLRDTAVLFDQEKMTQILSNLLTHTINTTNAGGRIILRVSQEGEGRSGYGSYLFEMSHTGVSMTDQEIEHIFDLNQQIGRGIVGSVFGLSVVKQLSEMMGGDITVKARPGVGNSYSVRVTMPLMSNEESNRIIADKRILVVDDNLLNSEIVADLLREAGAVVEIVSSGEEAVDMVSNFYEGYYDIVLTDIQMTGIDGYETARLIREIPWATKDALKIIALSAFEYDAQKDREEGRAFNAYCMKPFDIRKFAVAAFDGADE